MKLERFKEKNRKKTGIIVFTMCCILLITGAFFYNSFALFSEKKNFNIINGNVEDPGDLYFAYYVDDEITYNVPNKDSGYTLSDKSVCTNGVTLSWDDYSWTVKVNYTNYIQENNSRTKCNLYFEKKKNATNFFLEMADSNESLLYDETTDNNLRYIGSNPDNYIDIGDRDIEGNIIFWRIIGVMNDIKDIEGNIEPRVKLIRSESIGEYSWDTSPSNINDGLGVNEWSESDVMKLLNPGYEDESIGGSLYWNKTSGNCYNATNNSNIACDFTSIGLSEDSKKYIDSVLWHTGDLESSVSTIKASELYLEERADYILKNNCVANGTYCNDTVERKTSWTGYIGLVYPSDFAYATSDGIITRNKCLESFVYDYFKNECTGNNWLETIGWTITGGKRHSVSGIASGVTYVNQGINSNERADMKLPIFPTIFLNNNVRIANGGKGTTTNPYTIYFEEP